MVDLNIPVGVSDFEKLRENNYYYIDKTGFISKLLQTKSAEVTLITRPRRFGKTLGMRMLASFFDIRKDCRTIFEGLEISKNTALCDEWMNQYPTLFLSFKDVDGLTFSSACDMLMYTISDLYQQHLFRHRAVDPIFIQNFVPVLAGTVHKFLRQLHTEDVSNQRQV